VRPVIDGILRELLTRHLPACHDGGDPHTPGPAGHDGGDPQTASLTGTAGHVHLNDLAEVIGERPVTPEEIEYLVDQLEAAGLRVGEDLDGADVEVVRAVLASARRLRASLGRRPTVAEIARDAALPAHAVRRALEHGAAASRPRQGPGARH